MGKCLAYYSACTLKPSREIREHSRKCACKTSIKCVSRVHIQMFACSACITRVHSSTLSSYVRMMFLRTVTLSLRHHCALIVGPNVGPCRSYDMNEISSVSRFLCQDQAGIHAVFEGDLPHKQGIFLAQRRTKANIYAKFAKLAQMWS